MHACAIVQGSTNVPAISAVLDISLLLQSARMPVHLFDEALDPQLLAIERHLLAILCARRWSVLSLSFSESRLG